MYLLKVLCITSLVAVPLCAAHDPQYTKVAVVGGGLAGLTAAYRLHEHGIDVHTYEARGRVGGRVFTAVLDGKTVELGGQNIRDGGQAKHLLELVKELKLELDESSFPIMHQYYINSVLSPENLYYKDYQGNEEALKDQLEALALHSKNMNDVLLGLFSKDDDIYKMLSIKLAAYEGNLPEKLSVSYITTLYHMLLGGSCSAHPSSRIELLSIKDGNGLLPEKLAHELGNSVHLNMPLVALAKNADESFILTFKNGHQLIADVVILAIPASVYKDISFSHGVIAGQKRSAIREIEYGANSKIILPVTCPLSDTDSFQNERICTWPDPIGSLITMYYTGDGSTFSADSLNDRYLQEKEMLIAGLGAQCLPELQPILARDEPFACYTGPIAQSWPTDPYAYGSYSYIAPGQEIILSSLVEEADEIVKELFAPQGKLYFAGEHTSILIDVPGTMEAACESGERTARMIAKALLSK